MQKNAYQEDIEIYRQSIKNMCSEKKLFIPFVHENSITKLLKCFNAENTELMSSLCEDYIKCYSVVPTIDYQFLQFNNTHKILKIHACLIKLGLDDEIKEIANKNKEQKQNIEFQQQYLNACCYIQTPQFQGNLSDLDQVDQEQLNSFISSWNEHAAVFILWDSNRLAFASYLLDMAELEITLALKEIDNKKNELGELYQSCFSYWSELWKKIQQEKKILTNPMLARLQIASITANLRNDNLIQLFTLHLKELGLTEQLLKSAFELADIHIDFNNFAYQNLSKQAFERFHEHVFLNGSDEQRRMLSNFTWYNSNNLHFKLIDKDDRVTLRLPNISKKLRNEIFRVNDWMQVSIYEFAEFNMCAQLIKKSFKAATKNNSMNAIDTIQLNESLVICAQFFKKIFIYTSNGWDPITLFTDSNFISIANTWRDCVGSELKVLLNRALGFIDVLSGLKSMGLKSGNVPTLISILKGFNNELMSFKHAIIKNSPMQYSESYLKKLDSKLNSLSEGMDNNPNQSFMTNSQLDWARFKNLESRFYAAFSKYKSNQDTNSLLEAAIAITGLQLLAKYYIHAIKKDDRVNDYRQWLEKGAFSLEKRREYFNVIEEELLGNNIAIPVPFKQEKALIESEIRLINSNINLQETKEILESHRDKINNTNEIVKFLSGLKKSKNVISTKSIVILLGGTIAVSFLYRFYRWYENELNDYGGGSTPGLLSVIGKIVPELALLGGGIGLTSKLNSSGILSKIENIKTTGMTNNESSVSVELTENEFGNLLSEHEKLLLEINELEKNYKIQFEIQQKLEEEIEGLEALLEFKAIENYKEYNIIYLHDDEITLSNDIDNNNNNAGRKCLIM